MFRTKREARVTPRRTSRSDENEKIELIDATTANASSGRKVLGRGLFKKRGMVIRGTRRISGYNDIGRTNVLPPKSEGKNGKLVTGSVKNRSPQINLVNLG
jgi:hypothetical protein